MSKTKLNWRLGKLPSPDEVRELVKDKIITHEEAREILFSEIDEQNRDEQSLKDEIKFLRQLVEKISKDRTTVVESIREVERPWRVRPGWYDPYVIWCSNLTYTNSSGSETLHVTSGTSEYATNKSFSEIETF